MSNQANDQLHARIGSERKTRLSEHANQVGRDLKDVTADAVDLYLKEVNGNRTEPANIAKLSPYDIAGASFFIGAILAGVLTLAGEQLMIATLAFAVSGAAFWGWGQSVYRERIQ